MNAAEQAKGLELAAKIAAAVNLFKSYFPDAQADLKPWANDPGTRELVDPDSIDIGFHLPGWSPRFQARSILVQIRLFEDEAAAESGEGAIAQTRRVIGLEAVGLTHQGEQWRLSTVGEWRVLGTQQPVEEIQTRLRSFCTQVYELFNGNAKQGGEC
ncbi:hypothetical protein HPC62_14890 [Thermoleptolyngbya sichuanensis A183]|uniref:Uncharacterized protein n=1 Tax=Thermoleptolyngbya sichuanensis A183 TaxID=2737172 RepID=A0A6M8BI21_9CYAN|nr:MULTISPECIES: hypothetical protein [Thermoleptolyngbya]QKD83311.1 hypothetical protein HPC62_14890 [Thermoleptolyngbya sichuanensis A183]